MDDSFSELPNDIEDAPATLSCEQAVELVRNRYLAAQNDYHSMEAKITGDRNQHKQNETMILALVAANNWKDDPVCREAAKTASAAVKEKYDAVGQLYEEKLRDLGGKLSQITASMAAIPERKHCQMDSIPTNKLNTVGAPASKPAEP